MTRNTLRDLVDAATDVFTFTPSTLRGVMVNVQGEEALFNAEPAAGYVLLYLDQAVTDGHHVLPPRGQSAHSR